MAARTRRSLLTLALTLLALAVTVPADAAQSARFVVPLEAGQVTPGPGDTDAEGGIFVAAFSTKGTLCAFVNTTNVSTPLSVDLHRGSAGTVGPAVAEIIPESTDPDPANCASLDPALARDIEKHPQDYYFDIHNAEFPDGALRGQISATTFSKHHDRATVNLRGDQVVPGPGDPNGAGGAFLDIETEPSRICFDVNPSNISSPVNQVDIHRAPVGSVGPSVAVLHGPVVGTDDTRVTGCVGVSDALATDMAENNADYYVDVHNDEFPDGAVRGQLR